MKKLKNKNLTVKEQIQKSNSKVIWIVVGIVVLSLLNLGLIDWYQYRLNNFTERVSSAKDVIIQQYKWVTQVGSALDRNSSDVPEMDPQKCSFAIWYEEVKDKTDSEAQQYLKSAYDMHLQMHTQGAEALQYSYIDIKSSRQTLDQDVTESNTQLCAALENYQVYYQAKADKSHDNLVSRVIWAICTNVVLAIGAAVFARRLGNKLAKEISEPIKAVADWSEELSQGAANLEFDSSEQTDTKIVEVSRMIDSFRVMANSIQENVNVVQKVADGDMTAFVNIRSASDSLGKNLYRMVQSNDLMFAEISTVAQSVADGSSHIAMASQSLAESCSVQASAVQEFSEAIVETGEFIEANNEKTIRAKSVSDEIQQEVFESTQKMEELLRAMADIRDASQKVAAIIGTINDIAGQTNMLALNAAIEAARAGEAGKGFAVVAEEVKDLAVKSAQAAEESKKLILDTMEKTELGDTISQETSQTFGMITTSIQKIADITQEIVEAGRKQQEHITIVKQNIAEISDAIDGNAAASEETAAASDELNHNADELKASMQKFNLRKRTPGKPYIPPEKRNDAEFIRIAEENYRKALQAGKVPKDAEN